MLHFINSVGRRKHVGVPLGRRNVIYFTFIEMLTGAISHEMTTPNAKIHGGYEIMAFALSFPFLHSYTHTFTPFHLTLWGRIVCELLRRNGDTNVIGMANIHAITQWGKHECGSQSL